MGKQTVEDSRTFANYSAQSQVGRRPELLWGRGLENIEKCKSLTVNSGLRGCVIDLNFVCHDQPGYSGS